MARTREFDEAEALEAAMQVFCENGYEGTSLQNLEEAMGLNRTSIYNAFGNKRSVFNKVLVLYVENGKQCWEEVLAEASTAKAGIEALLNKVVDMHFGSNAGSCLLTLSTMEKSQHDNTAQNLIEQAMHAFKKMIHKRLEAAKKGGEFRKEFDALGVATVITSMFSGFMVLGKANFPKATMRKAVQASLALLETG